MHTHTFSYLESQVNYKNKSYTIIMVDEIQQKRTWKEGGGNEKSNKNMTREIK